MSKRPRCAAADPWCGDFAARRRLDPRGDRHRDGRLRAVGAPGIAKLAARAGDETRWAPRPGSRSGAHRDSARPWESRVLGRSRSRVHRSPARERGARGHGGEAPAHSIRMLGPLAGPPRSGAAGTAWRATARENSPSVLCPSIRKRAFPSTGAGHQVTADLPSHSLGSELSRSPPRSATLRFTDRIAGLPHSARRRRIMRAAGATFVSPFPSANRVELARALSARGTKGALRPRRKRCDPARRPRRQALRTV